MGILWDFLEMGFLCVLVFQAARSGWRYWPGTDALSRAVRITCVIAVVAGLGLVMMLEASVKGLIPPHAYSWVGYLVGGVGISATIALDVMTRLRKRHRRLLAQRQA